MVRIRGFGLAEAVVSIFLLSTVVVMVLTMLNTSLRYQGQAQRRAIAAMLARTTFDQIRAWAWDAPGGALNYLSDWSTYNGVALSDPQHPSYRIEVRAEPGTRPLFSPSSTLESGFAARAKRMDSSLVPVSVKVSWQDGATPQQLELFSYVGEPPREIGRIVVSRTGGAAGLIPREGVVDLSAEALDVNEQPMADVMFRWYVEPAAPNPGDDPGLATLLPPWGPPVAPPLPATPRHGRQARIKHSYIRADGVTWGYSEGFCRIIAVATAQGRDYRGEIVVRLAP